MSKMKSKTPFLGINFLKNNFFKLFFGFLILPAVFSLASCSKKTDFAFNIPDFYASPVFQSSKQTGDGKVFCYNFSKAQSIAFSDFFDSIPNDSITFGKLFKVSNLFTASSTEFAITLIPFSIILVIPRPATIFFIVAPPDFALPVILSRPFITLSHFFL